MLKLLKLKEFQNPLTGLNFFSSSVGTEAMER